MRKHITWILFLATGCSGSLIAGHQDGGTTGSSTSGTTGGVTASSTTGGTSASNTTSGTTTGGIATCPDVGGSCTDVLPDGGNPCTGNSVSNVAGSVWCNSGSLVPSACCVPTGGSSTTGGVFCPTRCDVHGPLTCCDGVTCQAISSNDGICCNDLGQGCIDGQCCGNLVCTGGVCASPSGTTGGSTGGCIAAGGECYDVIDGGSPCPEGTLESPPLDESCGDLTPAQCCVSVIADQSPCGPDQEVCGTLVDGGTNPGGGCVLLGTCPSSCAGSALCCSVGGGSCGCQCTASDCGDPCGGKATGTACTQFGDCLSNDCEYNVCVGNGATNACEAVGGACYQSLDGGNPCPIGTADSPLYDEACGDFAPVSCCVSILAGSSGGGTTTG